MFVFRAAVLMFSKYIGLLSQFLLFKYETLQERILNATNLRSDVLMKGMTCSFELLHIYVMSRGSHRVQMTFIRK